MNLLQKWIAYCLGLFDALLHSYLIFGWSALTSMYKKEGYFRHDCLQDEIENCPSQNAKISEIMIYAAAFCGITVFLLRGFTGKFIGQGLGS